MKILIKKASNYNFNEVREVEPQDLIKLIDEFNCEIIVEKTMEEQFIFTGAVVDGHNEQKSLGFISYTIIIYDDYIE